MNAWFHAFFRRTNNRYLNHYLTRLKRNAKSNWSSCLPSR